MNRTVKNYEIRRVLGEGAMGMVYYALDLTLQREAALKSLRPDLAQQQKVIDRFRAEAQTQAKLNHQNIAHIYEYFQFGTEHFMAMEFINGKTLSVVLRERGRLPFEEAGRYIIQALRGLAHAHRHRVIHRDVKPANLMLNTDGVIKVTDFGIARVVGADRATRIGLLLGTYEYISPEAVEGKDTTDLSDLYSTGIVLFELVTGQLPFSGASEYELVRKHVEAERPSLRDLGLKDVPSEFEAAIRRAMDPNPRKRFKSADEMADALQTCLDRHRQRTSGGTGGWWQRWLPGISSGAESVVPGPPTAAPAAPPRTDISTATRRVEDLLERHLWDEANRVVEDCWRSHPDEPELADLRSRIQRQHQAYEQNVQQHVVLARDLMERDLPDAALSVVGNALTQYPRATPLLDLKRECSQRIELRRQRSDEVAQIQRHVDELTAAGKYQAAADYILELQERAKDQGELGSILGRVMQAHREYDRNQAILQVLAEARALAGRGSWQEALATLDQAVEKYARDTRLTGLRDDLQDEWRAEQIRQAVERMVAEAAAIEKSSPENARQKIASGLEQFPENALLKQELARLDAVLEARRRAARIAAAMDSAAKLRRQRKWQESVTVLDTCRDRDGPDPKLDDLRALVAAEYQAHQAFLERFVTESRKLIEASAWEQAILKLSSAVREMPGELVLTEMLQEAHQGLANKRRAETVARIKAEAEAHIASQQFDTAIQSLLDAVSQYPEDQTLSTALSHAVFARDAFIAQQKVRAALDLAAGHWERREHEPAIAALRHGLEEVRDSAELLEKLDDYETEWAAVRRQRELDEIAAVLEEGIRTGDFQAAVERAAAGVARYPGDRDVLDLQARARAEQRRVDAGKALADAQATGAELEKKQSWDAAAQVYAAALESYPEIEPKLRARLDNARVRELAARRAERLVSAESRFRASLDDALLDDAEQVLNQARDEFSAEPSFKKWQKELAEARRLAARAAALGKAAAIAAKLIEEQEFDEAERTLSVAEKVHGADPSLRAAHGALLEGRKNYAGALESALKDINDLIDGRDFDAAIAAADAGQARFPKETRFRELASHAAERRDEENRQNHISQIRILLSNGALDHAEVLVRYARNNYPDDPAFQELDRELAAARRFEADRERFSRQRPEVERLARGRDWARAKELIEPYLETPQIQDEARQIFDRLDAEETVYRERTESIDRQAREFVAAKRFEEAAALLANAHAEFPEIERFGTLREEVHSYIEIEKEARLLDETERSVRDLVRQNQFTEALARVDRVLASRPGEARLRDLRAVVVASLQEQESIAAIAAEVDRLAGQQRGADAERTLIEGLRRFPSSSKLQDLRPAVDAARKAEWEREASEAREANRQREAAEIERMIAQREYDLAAAALEALDREYGAEAGADLADQLELARQSDEQQVARFLADVDRLRAAAAWPRALALFRDLPPWMAEDSRVADRRGLVFSEAEAALEREREEKAAARQAAALSASKQEQESIAATADEVERLTQQQRGADAERALIDGLRKFPLSSRLQDLRPAVDAARKGEWEREAREASRNREAAEIQRMIGQHELRSAAAALEALNREYGADAGADLAKQLELAREADGQQVARFLAKVDRLRSAAAWPRALALFRDLPPWLAEDIRVVDARELASREAEAALVREEEEKAAAQQAAALSRSLQEQENIAAIADEVEGLAREQRGADAERALIDGLRRFPSSSRLQDLRPAVDAARKAEWEREAREARRNREAAEIQRMIGQHQFRSAAAALEALNREYSAEAGADLAKQLAIAREADEQQVGRFLADIDRLRSAGAWPRALAMFRDLPPWIANDGRVVNARDLATREAEAARAREEEQRLLEERQRQEREAAAQQAAALSAAIQEQETVAAIADEVDRLVREQCGADAERALIEGLRRFPKNSKLLDLRPVVDAVRKAQWEREAREASRNREAVEIHRMIGQHQLRAAAAALEALNLKFGAEAGADLAKQLELARQADDQQVVRFLADVDRLRSAKAWTKALGLLRDLPPWIAEDSRVAERRGLVTQEADAVRAREEEQRLLEKRKAEDLQAAAQQAAAMVASIQEQEGIAAITAEVNRLTGQRRWDDAERALIEGLGKYPSSSKLQELRLLTDVARQSALERESREAARKRDMAKIQRMIGQHHFRSAAAALEALNREHGAGAGAELAKQLDLARQADDQQIAHFLADVDRLRSAGVWSQALALFRDLPPWMAEDSRVADRRELVSREADAQQVRDEASPAPAASQEPAQAAWSPPDSFLSGAIPIVERKPWWQNYTYWIAGAIVLAIIGFLVFHHPAKQSAPVTAPSTNASPAAAPPETARGSASNSARTGAKAREPQANEGVSKAGTRAAESRGAATSRANTQQNGGPGAAGQTSGLAKQPQPSPAQVEQPQRTNPQPSPAGSAEPSQSVAPPTLPPSSQPAKAPAIVTPPTTAPPLELRKGSLAQEVKLQRDQTFSIDKGNMFGKKVFITGIRPDFIQVIEPPSPANNWSKLVLKNNGSKGKFTVVVYWEEMP